MCLTIVRVYPVGSWSLVIQHVVHRPTAVQIHSKRLHKIALQLGWCYDSGLHCHREITEIVINTNSVCCVALHVAGNTVACVGESVHVVRKFNLQEIGGTTLTVPHHLILQRVLS